MITTGQTRPQQKVLKSEKATEVWQQANVNYWIGRCNIYPVSTSNVITLYNAAAGKLDETEYAYVTNPLSTDKENLKGFPSKIRNIDIISPNIQMMLGELNQRFFQPQCVALNSNLKNIKKDSEKQLHVESMQQMFVNDLVKKGYVPEEIAKMPKTDEQIQAETIGIVDSLAEMGQQALDYIMSSNEVSWRRRKTFFDFIVTSRMFTYRDIKRNSLIYETISPLEIGYIGTSNLTYIENADAVKRTVRMSVAEIMDFFIDFDDFQPYISTIETRVSGGSAYNPSFTGVGANLLISTFGENFNNTADGLLVDHVQWTSMKQMQRVTGKDVTGNEYTEDYDEDYETLPEEKVFKYWVNEVWEGYRIDNDMILGVREVPTQRGSFDNPSRVKKSYNGRLFFGNYVTPTSIVEKGIVYQIKYNIVHYYLESMLARNMDKVTLFPLGLIPEKEGWDETTVMYYAKAHGFLFVDETNPNAIAAMQHVRALDLSLNSYIKEVYGILTQIKSDWDEAIGVTRQRKGQSMASDGKSVTEQAIFRSSVISEEFFQQHEETIIKDLQCLVELSQIAWSDETKKATFLNSNFKTVEMEIHPEIHSMADYQIFCKNSGEEKRKHDVLAQQIGTIAQQTQEFSILGKILNENNLSELIIELEGLEAKVNKRNLEKEQADRDNAKQIQVMQSEDKQREDATVKYKIDEDNETKKTIAIGNNQTALLLSQVQDLNDNGIPDVLEVEKLAFEREKLYKQLELDKAKLGEDKANRLDNRELTLKKLDTELTKARMSAAAKNKKS